MNNIKAHLIIGNIRKKNWSRKVNEDTNIDQ